MSKNEDLSREELGALREVASGLVHKPIAAVHAEKLLKLKLIYTLLGSYRLTFEGRQRLREDQQSKVAGEKPQKDDNGDRHANKPETS